jgi:hypothetical protein
MGIQAKVDIQILEGLVKTFEVYKPDEDVRQTIMKILEEENESDTKREDVSD